MAGIYWGLCPPRVVLSSALAVEKWWELPLYLVNVPTDDGATIPGGVHNIRTDYRHVEFWKGCNRNCAGNLYLSSSCFRINIITGEEISADNMATCAAHSAASSPWQMFLQLLQEDKGNVIIGYKINGKKDVNTSQVQLAIKPLRHSTMTPLIGEQRADNPEEGQSQWMRYGPSTGWNTMDVFWLLKTFPPCIM